MGYARDELQAMPRSKLQAICKGIGFKANESTSKIIENILTYEADNAAHRLRSTKPVASAADTNSRRVTRSLEVSKQIQIQESKSSRRTSTRLASTSSRRTSSAAQPRKSKVSQMKLGVGRPKTVGGSGARAVTRNSTSSIKVSNVSKKGKQRAVEEDTIEEEEEEDGDIEMAFTSKGKEITNDTNQQAAEVVVTGLPPTPAATPNLASNTQDAASNDESRHIPSNFDFAPFTKLQDEMRELSSQYQLLKDQVKLVAPLQQEIRSLRSAIDRQAGELDQARKDARAITSLKKEIADLKGEVAALRTSFSQAILNQNENPVNRVPMHHGINPQIPGTTTQVLGKRVRDAATPSTKTIMPVDLTSTDASSLSAMQSPQKKQRIEEEEMDGTFNAQSPIRLGSQVEPAKGLEFSSIFNFDGTSGNTGNELSTRDQTSEQMLGVPPPGFTADFLTHPTTPLPFALIPSGATGTDLPEIATTRVRREHSPRKISGSRLNPYRRTTGAPSGSRGHTASNDPFGFLGSDLLSSNMHSANHPEPSVGVNPAQLLAQGLFDPEKTPAAARTLYGTELDGDTRFGEFGIDGLTKSFWKAPGFPC